MSYLRRLMAMTSGTTGGATALVPKMTVASLASMPGVGMPVAAPLFSGSMPEMQPADVPAAPIPSDEASSQRQEHQREYKSYHPETVPPSTDLRAHHEGEPALADPYPAAPAAATVDAVIARDEKQPEARQYLDANRAHRDIRPTDPAPDEPLGEPGIEANKPVVRRLFDSRAAASESNLAMPPQGQVPSVDTPRTSVPTAPIAMPISGRFAATDFFLTTAAPARAAQNSEPEVLAAPPVFGLPSSRHAPGLERRPTSNSSPQGTRIQPIVSAPVFQDSADSDAYDSQPAAVIQPTVRIEQIDVYVKAPPSAPVVHSDSSSELARLIGARYLGMR